MRIFLCGLPANSRMARRAGEILEDAGHEIYSSWVYGGKLPRTNADKAEAAMRDFRDLVKSDCVVAIAGTVAGIKDEVFGAGVAFNKRMVLIGKPNNPFHLLPMVDRYDSVEDFIKELREENG